MPRNPRSRLTTGTVRVGETTATGYLNAFANFDLALYMPAPGPTAVVALVGFPEFDDSSTTPPGPTGGPKYTNCNLVNGMATVGSGNPGSNCPYGVNSPEYNQCIWYLTGYVQPQCPAPKVEVRAWVTTDQFSLVDTPVGTLTTGSDIVTGSAGSTIQGCRPGGGDFTPTPLSKWYAVTSLNNVTAMRQLISEDGYVSVPSACPNYYRNNYASGNNLMCCELVAP